MNNTAFPSLHEMVTALGFERLAGTEGEFKAARLIESWLEIIGVSVKKHPFNLNGFMPGSAEITVGEQTFTATPLGGCGSTKVSAPLVFIENPNAIVLSPESFRGKIVLSYGRPRELHYEIKQAGIAALCIISPPFREATSLSHRQHHGGVSTIPAVTLDYETAVQLASCDGRQAHLRINQELFAATAYNLEVDFPGTDPDGSVTWLVGHYDSVARSPGASDNAGGTVVLLHSIAYLCQHPPKRNLKVVFFSGEELGLLGSLAYAKQEAETIKQRGRLVINIDIAGDDLGNNGLIVTGTKELIGYSAGIAREAGIYCNPSLSLYSSDSIPFARLGVPSINLARGGGQASFYCHTPGDQPIFTSERGLQVSYRFAQTMLQHILSAQLYPVDREIDNSLRPPLEHYLFNLCGDKPELDWPPGYLKPA